jgi:tripartite-type tricarboxylate transporter receptor subunit TctC
MLAPAGTPEAIVNKMSAAIGKALHDPDTVQKLRVAGIAPTYMDAKEFAPFLRAEYDKWGKVVKDTGATVN